MDLRRKMPGRARPYRMWGYPAPTLWAFVACLSGFMADALVTQTQASLMASSL